MRLRTLRAVMSGGGGQFRVRKNRGIPVPARQETLLDMNRFTIYVWMGVFIVRLIFGSRTLKIDLERQRLAPKA